MLGPGTRLADRYRVERTLGTGGMGVVVLATDEVLGRQVAIKRIHADPGGEQGRRIRREARLGASLNHPAVVAVLDTLADEDGLFIVMEYVEGETLADVLARGPLAPDEALRVLRPVAAALDHAHAHGVVHRDVKPANVLLSASGRVKLADLGVATSADVTQITRTGGVVGTAAYVAPEQLEPEPATPAADVYALAATAFEALSGRRARTGATAYAVLDAAQRGDAPDLREALPQAPAAAGDVLRRGMARDPAARPASAGELVDELAAAFQPEPAPTPAPPPPPSRPAVQRRTARPRPAPPPPEPAERRSRALLPAVLALLAGAAVVLAVVLAGGGGDEPRTASSPRARTQRTTTTARPPATTTSAPAAPSASDAAARSPAAAVRGLYERAANGDFDGAWRLAGPGARAQFDGSLERFRGTLGTLRSITFRRLAVRDATATSAIVDVETVARHTDRTDRCRGTVRTARGPEGWLVETLGVRCG
jgi:serine/threonine protein kinase